MWHMAYVNSVMMSKCADQTQLQQHLIAIVWNVVVFGEHEMNGEEEEEEEQQKRTNK